MKKIDTAAKVRLGALKRWGIAAKGGLLPINRANDEPFVPELLADDERARRVAEIVRLAGERGWTAPAPCTVAELRDSRSRSDALFRLADAIADSTESACVWLNGEPIEVVRLVGAIAARTYGDCDPVNWVELLATLLPAGWTAPVRSLGGRPSVTVPDNLRVAVLATGATAAQLRKIAATMNAEDKKVGVSGEPSPWPSADEWDPFEVAE